MKSYGFMVLKPENVTKHSGLPDESLMNTWSDSKRRLIILDDLLSSVLHNKSIYDLFTKKIHHHDLSVLFLSQTIFDNGLRIVSLNCSYFILTRTSRDLNQVKTLFSQINPGNSKAIMDFYKDAISDLSCYPPHFLVDVHPFANFNFQFQSCIFSKNRIIYRL